MIEFKIDTYLQFDDIYLFRGDIIEVKRKCALLTPTICKILTFNSVSIALGVPNGQTEKCVIVLLDDVETIEVIRRHYDA